MDTKSLLPISLASSPKRRKVPLRKPAVFRGLRPIALENHLPTHFPPPVARNGPETGHSGPPAMGEPVGIQVAARLIGLSPWSIRHRLIPLGLPYFRSGASGKLIFYTDQLLRWIQQHQGGTTR